MATASTTPSPERSRYHSVILPVRGWVPLKLGDVVGARHLLFLFAWRDISARYRQTLLGAGWAILQPLTTAAVFTLFMGRLAKLPSEGLPYAVFALAGLVPWTFFSNAVSAASESLIGSGSVITKVYFPRLVLPLGTMGAWLPDALIATVVVVVVALVYGVALPWTIVLAPLFLMGALVAAAAVGIGLAPLNVGYRDVRYLSVVLLQLWMFASPIVYPLSRVPDSLKHVYSLNPMVGVVSGYRWAMTGAGHPPWTAIAVSGAATLALLALSITYFRRVEHRLADVI